MDYNITLTANHQSLTAEYLPLAAESVQYLTAKVVCETEDWTGREIKAMFGQGCTVHEVPVTGGEITAKQQLNLTAGDWCVWLVGNSARDGEVIPRITTNIAHISVAPTGGTEGNPFPAIPPTVEEQLRADMGNLADLTTEDKSSLVAAINEAAASGGTADAVTYTPQTLTEEQKSQARTNIGAEKAGTAYTKPTSGIPKSDLAEDVQTSLAKADTAISYDSQTLTDEQKSQARTNIGAGDDRLPKVSSSDTGKVLGVEQIGEFEYGYALTHMPTLSDLIPLGITNASPGQFAKVSFVDDFGGPTAWEAADIYEKPDTGIPKTDLADDVQISLAKADTAISLGLTAATPGQIIKVKAVQDGKPTEWEAVDMPSEGVEWYEVIDMETTENVNDLIVSTDKNGRPISGYHALAMVLCLMIPADSTQTSDSGSIWVYPVANNYLSGATRTIITVNSWKTITRTFNFLFAGSNRAIFVSGANNANTFDGSYNNVFNGIRLYIHKDGDHLPTGTKVRCLVLSKGWMA